MGMRFTRVLILREQLLQNAALESFIFTCLIYKKSFQNGPVHEFYGLKASQMSKVCASSHEYPHAEKIKNLRERNFKGEASNKQMDSEETQRSDFSS